MAVLDPKKLLPQSKKESRKTASPNATRFLVPTKNVQYKSTAVIPTPTDNKNSENFDYIKKDVYVIKEKVISIEEILKKSLSLKQKSLNNKYKDIENKKRRQREDILERKPKKNLIDTPSVQTPRLSFLDKLKNFITYTLLGFVVMKLWKHLPQILKFTKLIGPAVTFFDSFIGGLADKLITFIDWGYKAYDKVREFTKKIGGDSFQKTFDEFSGKLNTFINLAIIAGMSTMGGTDFGMGKKPKGPKLPTSKGPTGSQKTNTNLSNYINRGKEAKLVERKFGNNAAKYYEQLRESGKNSAQAFNEVKRRFQPRGLFNRQSVAGLAGEGRTAGQLGKRGLGRTGTRLAARGFGKSGARIAKGATKALGRFPIIGPLVDFAFRYFVLREPLGKSAAGAVGAGVGQALGTWLGGTVGGVAGTVVPIVGNLIGAGAGAAIGGIIGGLIGDQLGVSLYETISAYQTPGKIEGRASGGQVTRGGKSVSRPIKRTLNVRRKTPKPPPLKAPDVNIGKDVGGKKVIEKVFSPEDKTKPNQVSSLRALSKISKTLRGTNTNFFSQIAGVGIDLAMGQKPSKNFIRQFGSAFGGILQELIDTNAQMSAMDTARSILAMANGGMVPESMVTRGGNFGQKVGEAVSNMFQSFIDSQSSMIISILKQESIKDPISGGGTSPTNGAGETGGALAEGTLARGQITIEQLVGLAKGAGFSQSDAVIMAAIAMAESGGNSNVHNNNRATGDNSYGLWQINMIDSLGPARLKEFGISNYEQLKDPVVNAHAAKIIKQGSGFTAWSVYKSGKYKTHLAAAQRAAGSPSITVYKPGTGGGGFIPLGGMAGTLSEAQRLASSMGLQTTSTTHWSDGTRRSGLHGAGRAMDFSNDGVGRGTPQQLAFAREMVKRYGSKLEQLIYTPLGFGIANGKRVGLDYWGSSTNAQHYNHVHVAFKRGGYTGTGGIARLHQNEFVMNSNAVKFFGRETFEAMNAIGDKSAKYISAKLSRTKNLRIANNINEQTSYEKHQGTTVIILPIEKTTVSRTPIAQPTTMINYGNSSIDNTMHGALA